MARNSKICFTVVGSAKPIFANSYFSTLYESVVVYGQAGKVENEAEKQKALEKLCIKYMPGYEREISGAIERGSKNTDVYAISMDHVTGKAGRMAAGDPFFG
jgi:nitroimidazol reductase NimA-like FMN-containing flavoprotein (pyridoxamine 5'-phosphate oxidase superfamily)